MSKVISVIAPPGVIIGTGISNWYPVSKRKLPGGPCGRFGRYLLGNEAALAQAPAA